MASFSLAVSPIAMVEGPLTPPPNDADPQTNGLSPE